MATSDDKYARYTEEIRDNIVCGRCSASTLLLWERFDIRDGPRGASMTTIIEGEEQIEEAMYYLVRCSFFKFNVDQPENIVHCEGYKEKK